LSGLFIPKEKAISHAGVKVLSNSNLSYVSGEIEQAIQVLQEGGGRVVLVIDQLDFLLAASGNQASTVALADMVMGLREVRPSC